MPEPFGAWEGVRNATAFGNVCIQNVHGGWVTVEGAATSSEDCLYLNVVSPIAPAASGLHPVVVYLHAGEFHVRAHARGQPSRLSRSHARKHRPLTTRPSPRPLLDRSPRLLLGRSQYGAASDRESDWPFADDVVLVTPNSRLGAFGYLGSAELRHRTADGSTGSYGLADQRLALQWVRDNIEAFGGAPPPFELRAGHGHSN
jgi:carboxylesterase type B